MRRGRPSPDRPTPQQTSDPPQMAMCSQFAPIRIDGPVGVLEGLPRREWRSHGRRRWAVPVVPRAPGRVAPGRRPRSQGLGPPPVHVAACPASPAAHGQPGLGQVLQGERRLPQGEPAAAHHGLQGGRVVVQRGAHPSEGRRQWSGLAPGPGRRTRPGPRSRRGRDLGTTHDGQVDRGEHVVRITRRRRPLDQRDGWCRPMPGCAPSRERRPPSPRAPRRRPRCGGNHRGGDTPPRPRREPARP